MGTILTIILEGFFVYLFKYPGAFVRWIITGRRRPFQEVLKGNWYLNGWIGLLTMFFLIFALVCALIIVFEIIL
ncbi:hypothetical protein [Chitinophaga sp.]|uniref:hypothetical protein n=1 Tax=Chitinophaga sp. TaxID=1869181 RepID=UPI0026375E8B|nr:hypothetical protein [uncultured Chitinophaga sp.]